MKTARSPWWAVLVGAVFLGALAGWLPGDAAGAMPEGQDRQPVKKTIPVVWRQSTTGNRGIPIVTGGSKGPMIASIKGSGSNRGATPGGSLSRVIAVSSSGARQVQLPASRATTIQVPEPVAIQVSERVAIRAPEPAQRAIQTGTRVIPSARLRGVQAYLGNESESDTTARSLQARFSTPPAGSGSGTRTATWAPSPPQRQSPTIPEAATATWSPPPQQQRLSSTIPATTGDDPGDYRLGPGDMIDVFVWRNPELSRKVPVRPDGRVSLPLVGEMVATGKTTRQVQDEITAILSQYIQVPTVTVTVTEIHSLVVYVVGNVGKPGPLQLSRNVTVLQAISMAGGLNEFADKNDIMILRTVNGQQQRIPFRYGDFVKGKTHGPEILLRAGDVVYVP